MREDGCYRITDARAGLGDPLMRRCERCGSAELLTHHHRVKRSHCGGHIVSNVVLLCGSCHPHVEHHADEAEVEGWVVKSGGDPRAVPIFHYPMNMRVLLDDDGMLIPTETDQ